MQRRFGVSIPADLADDLDELSRIMNIDRSKIVANALRDYIHDNLHALQSHVCRGVLVVVHDSDNNVPALLEVYKDIIKHVTHTHIASTCVDTLIVDGSSDRIIELKGKLMACSCVRQVKYLPL